MSTGDKEVDGDDIRGHPGRKQVGSGVAADWREGDFTGDGVVDGDDIEAILAANLFGAGPYASTPTQDGLPIRTADGESTAESRSIQTSKARGAIAYDWEWLTDFDLMGQFPAREKSETGRGRPHPCDGLT